MNGHKQSFLIFIATVIFLLFIPCIVKATTEISRNVEYKGQDEEGFHIFDYCIYLSDGKQEGTLKLPNYIYENEHWFIVIPRSNINNIYYVYIPTCEDLYIEGNFWNFCRSPQNTSDFKVAIYSFYFSGEEYFSNTATYLSSNSYEANCFIYSKGVNLYRFSKTDTSKIYSLDFLKENYNLKCPTLSYLSGKGFRLYLNDFYGSTTNDNFFEVIKSLTKVSIKVKNVGASDILFSDDNVLSYSDVQIDSSGRYYIDLLFSDYLTFMNSSDGEYIIELNCNLQSERNFLPASPYTYANSKTLYPSTFFVKYNYKKSTNSGILIDVDENGNEIDHGGGGGGEDTPPVEVDKTVDAIKDQTNKIEEQTNAIKEQTEVSKNIFQQIIELPR